ncbi:MAG: hypothetical protein HYU66_02690 [Armatimonadetes bacterium]|nr:hypothetical protein [Armatimonadota bacterium]
MSVEEIIAEIRTLPPQDLERVKQVLAEVEGEQSGWDEDDPPPGVDPEAWRDGLRAWRELDEGLVEGSRTDLSQNIDEALYGGEL